MSEKDYPPLPEPALTLNQFGYPRSIELHDQSISGMQPVWMFTAQQLRAYIDADRAQRKPLTDEQCDAIAKALENFYQWWRSIDPLFDPSQEDYKHRVMKRVLELRNKAIREAITPETEAAHGIKEQP